jgi:hypothetical protein
MKHTLQYGVAAALTAFAAIAAGGTRNPAFAQAGNCRWGTANPCFRNEVCNEWGWEVTFWTPSFRRICQTKTVETFYWVPTPPPNGDRQRLTNPTKH